MTHVFYIHSAITEKVAAAIAESLDGQVVMIADERYPMAEAGARIDEIYALSPFRYNVTKNWRAIWAGDARVEALTDGAFHLYTPQTAIEKVRLLLSHRHCTGFSLMEEGLMSYCTQEQRDAVLPPQSESVRRSMGFLGRLGPRRFCREGVDTLYVLHDRAFPGYDETQRASATFGAPDESPGTRPGDCLLVPESLTFYDKKTACLYLQAFADMVDHIEDRYERAFYKLHPDSYGTWQAAAFRRPIEQSTLQGRELDRARCLEDVAVATGIDVFVNVSSAGLYCGLFSGGTVYSFHDHFASAFPASDRDAQGRIPGISDWIPDVFWAHTVNVGRMAAEGSAATEASKRVVE